MPFRAMETLEAGRDPQQMLADAKRDGTVYAMPAPRPAMLRDDGIDERPREADTVVVIGCGYYRSLDAVARGFRLLDLLGIDYTLLEKEFCCGAPMIGQQVRKGSDRAIADAMSRELIGMNIAQARQLKARRIAYFCVWCTYLAKRFYGDAFPGVR